MPTSYAYVHRAAHVLATPSAGAGAAVRAAFQALLAEWHRQPAEHFGSLAPASAHVQTVTASYWPGVFACYAVEDLPRTNNDLEHFFGTARHLERHLERRATGRTAASPALVVRGAVRVVAAVATRLAAVGAADLRPRQVDAWWALRRHVEARHATRRAQARFRRNPQAYLTS